LYLTGGEIVTPTRNLNHWASRLDLTCRSYTYNVTAISSTTFVGAWHYFPQVGATVQWVDKNNVVVERTVTAIGNIAVAANAAAEDVGWGTLDSPLPDTITPAVLPTADTLPAQVYPGTVATTANLFIWCNQFGQVNTMAFLRRYSGVVVNQYFQPSQPPVPPDGFPLPELFLQIVDGDSGSPWFYVLPNGRVAIMTSTYGRTVGPDYVGVVIPPT